MQILASALLALSIFAAPALAQEREAVWIDVRSAEEYAEDHIPGTENIAHVRIAEGIVALGLKPQDRIYLWCGSGRRSELAKDVLYTLGYRKVTDLKSLENAREKWNEEHADSKPAAADS